MVLAAVCAEAGKKNVSPRSKNRRDFRTTEITSQDTNIELTFAISLNREPSPRNRAAVILYRLIGAQSSKIPDEIPPPKDL
jgi:hypothetical protein